MISIKGLTKTYKGDIHALRGVDLDIPESGMFGLLGVNGAGKTTLMRIISGLLTPTDGSVSVFSNDIRTPQGKRSARSVLGYMPQELGLYPNLNAYEFLDYIGILKGIANAKARRQQIEELLDAVNLADAARRSLKGYSGGMKRRIGVAQALLGSPKVIIVDEPTSGLDPEERIRLRNLLAEVARKCAVILSTHIVEDIGYSCRELAVINGGRVLFRGSPQDLAASAQGKSWLIKTSGDRPSDELLIISTLQMADGVQYRVLGDAQAVPSASPVEPTLEDGYIWLMQQSRKV